MKGMKVVICVLAVCFLVTAVTVVKAQQANEFGYPRPETYMPSLADIEKKYKKRFDDPRPYLNELQPKKILPKVIYDEISGNPEELKKAWADVVGFKAPDVVGKIHPEIKAGKYTYKDVQSNPAFKELMYPELYNRVGTEKPNIGWFSEFEIIPTRQYYQWKGLTAATKEHMGKAKLLPNGFLNWATYEGGIPFPRPSGPQKANQLMMTVEKRYMNWEDMWMVGRTTGFNKAKRIDYDGQYEVRHMKLMGRTLMKPYGYRDARAKDRAEFRTFILAFPAPRDLAGTTEQALYYLDPEKADSLMVFVPSMRRVRKLTSSDTQDAMVGLDCTYDDNEGIMQKMSPTRYPYKFEIIGEREFLVIAPTMDGAEYMTQKGEFKNIRLERRPMYVLQMTQLDPSYIYSRRIMYVDKEMLVFSHVENYDRKNRLYRSYDSYYGFFPDIGGWNWSGHFTVMLDYIDQHSTWEQPYVMPAAWSRADVSLEQFMKAK